MIKVFTLTGFRQRKPFMNFPKKIRLHILLLIIFRYFSPIGTLHQSVNLKRSCDNSVRMWVYFFFKKDNTKLSCRNGSCNFLWGLNCALWWSWFGSTSTILNANENFHTGHSGLKIRKNLEFLEAFFLSFIKHWSVHFFCHFGAQCYFLGCTFILRYLLW